ncbi:MAG TPA: hypothetical protein VN033_10830 [Vulgatibacter sp.]|nr:hypothetical protein [Vulgatibacter sp.]
MSTQPKPGVIMRKSFQLPLLAAISLVAILAVAACGDDGNGDGGGGSGGAGGSGGTQLPTPSCDELCDHITDDCSLVFTGADPDDPKPKCLEVCGNWRQPRILRCMIAVECVAGQDNAAKINACQSYAPCDTACDHLYDDCEMPIQNQDGEDLTKEECKQACPFQEWSDAAIDCLGTAECTVNAVNSCFAL